MILSFNSNLDKLASYVGGSGVGTLLGHAHLPFLGVHGEGASSFMSEPGYSTGNVGLTSPNF